MPRSKKVIIACAITGSIQTPTATMGAIVGGNVRVGLEDSLDIASGEMARSNTEQVSKIRHILEELSFDTRRPTKRAKWFRPRAAAPSIFDFPSRSTEL